MDEKILKEIIDQYRQMVGNRYDFSYLRDNYDLDPLVTKELTDNIRKYFLDYVYPDASQRQLLNKAFNDLEKHIKNPLHLLKLVGNASGLILKFGLQFPKALKTGLNILNSFNTAQEFEEVLLNQAQRMKFESPITYENVENLLNALPRKSLDNFIMTFEDLLHALTDTKLLNKTIQILNELIERMKNQNDFFSNEEIAALELGSSILDNGYQIFKEMSKKEKEIMIDLIIQNEKNFVDRIYRN